MRRFGIPAPYGHNIDQNSLYRTPILDRRYQTDKGNASAGCQEVTDR